MKLKGKKLEAFILEVPGIVEELFFNLIIIIIIIIKIMQLYMTHTFLSEVCVDIVVSCGRRSPIILLFVCTEPITTSTFNMRRTGYYYYYYYY